MTNPQRLSWHLVDIFLFVMATFAGFTITRINELASNQVPSLIIKSNMEFSGTICQGTGEKPN
jgi:hypothetical protein